MDTKEIHTNEITMWLSYLRDERHISDEVRKEAGVEVDYLKHELRIPIFDERGILLFYKYRRGPNFTEGPKYRYDKGATASLFGLETLPLLKPHEVLVITEGELDALAMRTLGYAAVSSTGGAGTWKKEWNDLLKDYDCVLLYDADRAGVEGMMRVVATGLLASIAWVPVEYGKDPTEVIHSGHAEELKQAINDALPYPMPAEDDSAEFRVSVLKSLIVRLTKERQELNSSRDKTPFHRDLALEWAKEKLADAEEDLWQTVKPARVTKFEGDNGVATAKAFPIRELVKVDRMGRAFCVYHEERSRSMQVYPDNHAYSYCCSRRSDAIDVWCALNGKDSKLAADFKEALKALQP